MMMQDRKQQEHDKHEEDKLGGRGSQLSDVPRRLPLASTTYEEARVQQDTLVGLSPAQDNCCQRDGGSFSSSRPGAAGGGGSGKINEGDIKRKDKDKSVLPNSPEDAPDTTQKQSVAESGSPPTASRPGIEKIAHPIPSDVLFGRGKPYQGHPGNLRLRQMVNRYKDEYLAARRYDKLAIAEEIVKGIQGGRWGDPGRFLRRLDGEEDYWVEADDFEAREKVSHALRGKKGSKGINSCHYQQSQATALAANGRGVGLCLSGTAEDGLSTGSAGMGGHDQYHSAALMATPETRRVGSAAQFQAGRGLQHGVRPETGSWWSNQSAMRPSLLPGASGSTLAEQVVAATAAAEKQRIWRLLNSTCLMGKGSNAARNDAAARFFGGSRDDYPLQQQQRNSGKASVAAMHGGGEKKDRVVQSPTGSEGGRGSGSIPPFLNSDSNSAGAHPSAEHHDIGSAAASLPAANSYSKLITSPRNDPNVARAEAVISTGEIAASTGARSRGQVGADVALAGRIMAGGGLPPSLLAQLALFRDKDGFVSPASVDSLLSNTSSAMLRGCSFSPQQQQQLYLSRLASSFQQDSQREAEFLTLRRQLALSGGRAGKFNGGTETAAFLSSALNYQQQQQHPSFNEVSLLRNVESREGTTSGSRSAAAGGTGQSTRSNPYILEELRRIGQRPRAISTTPIMSSHEFPSDGGSTAKRKGGK